MWLKHGGQKERGKLRNPIKLSHSAMSVVEECELCGWLHFRGYRRPSMPAAGITHGIDRVAKELCDRHRKARTLPVMINSSLTGELCQDRPFSLSWKHASQNCEVEGRLDEIFVVQGRYLAPLDHKTASGPPEEMRASVVAQLDLYSLLLSKWSLYGTFQASPWGYVLYHFPILESAGQNDERISIQSELWYAPISADRALERIERVLRIVRGSRPLASPDCEYCRWKDY